MADSEIIPAEAMKTTKAKQNTGIHENADKSYPFLFRYKKKDRAVWPPAQPSNEMINKVFRPNISASAVVHKFPTNNITAIATDDWYGFNVLLVFPRIYTAYEVIVLLPVRISKYIKPAAIINPFIAFLLAKVILSKDFMLLASIYF